MKRPIKHRNTKLDLSSELLRNLTASELMNAEGGSATHQTSTLHVTQPGPSIVLPGPSFTR